MKWFQRTPIRTARWVVLDCETSGLDIARDRLLSVGAVAVGSGRVELADCFDARVRQEAPSAAENIVIHGIGGDAQLQGRVLKEVMNELENFMRDGVPVAFHAPFDAGILRRHGLALRARWHWLGAFGIAPQARHEALGDAFATAQLLLIILNEAQRQRLETVEALLKTERAGRWLAHH